AFYSGAFIVPMIAALTGLKINKRMGVPAMIIGGIIALTGKLILSVGRLWWGNWIIIAAFIINFILLKIHSKNSFKKDTQKKLNNLTR
ncbi:MAG: hypothetical protein WCR33_06100, partial [Bacilli bacterium]